MKNKISIAAIVNTFNAAMTLDKCLKSIDWMDEIIIVDMNSKDNTCSIASAYTDKIFTFPPRGYVEPARNYAISKTSSDWIFILDADEFLLANARKIIRKIIDEPKILGYFFPRRNFINSKMYLKHGYFYPDFQLRLFRNNEKIRYSGKIHEQPIIDSRLTRKIFELKINHNYLTSKYRSFISIKKFIPYIRIESKNLKQSNPTQIQVFKKILTEFFRHFYRSYYKLQGYKDGYNGFRAAVIYSMYKELIIIFLLFNKSKIN